MDVIFKFYIDYDDWYFISYTQTKVKINTVPWGTICAPNDCTSFKEINFLKNYLLCISDQN